MTVRSLPHRSLTDAIKRSPLVAEPYKRLLDWRCRSVEAWIFVANAGRSGSKSLADMFARIESCVSLHEPSPKMLRDYPPDADPAAYYEEVFRSRKVVYIKRAAAGSRYYAETTHMFVKSFAEPAIRYFGEKIRVVHLVRDPVAVASSFYALGRIPGRDPLADLYLLAPSSPDNVLNVPEWFEEGGPFPEDFYRCLWYWYEMEARTRRLKAKYPDVVFHRIETRELNDGAALDRMFDVLGLEKTAQLIDTVAGTRSNLRSDLKSRSIDPGEAARMAAHLEKRLEDHFGSRFLG